MTRRIRTALIASAATALAVPAAGAAIAVPTVPQLADPPQYAIGTSITPSWSASTFTADATGKSYTVEVWDVMTGNHEFIQVNAPDTSHTWTGRQNGHTYRVRVSAQEIRCALKGLGGCLVWNATATSSPYSDWVETRTDTTDPTGSVAINGGAAYTSSRNVTLNLSASDPLSSGVGGVQISTDGAISCNVITDPDECPVGFAAVRQLGLGFAVKAGTDLVLELVGTGLDRCHVPGQSPRLARVERAGGPSVGERRCRVERRAVDDPDRNLRIGQVGVLKALVEAVDGRRQVRDLLLARVLDNDVELLLGSEVLSAGKGRRDHVDRVGA